LKICLLSVGKPRDAESIALHDRYAGRITRFGVQYECRFVAETRTGSRFTDEHVREREGRRLLEQSSGPGILVALDAGGTSMTSEQLAARLEAWATPRLCLAVGGPTGLSEEVRRAARSCWSLSRLTFPHELVRVLVAEQLYRALTILRHTPYHK